MSDLERGLRELIGASAGYNQAQRYFDGSVDEIFSNSKLRRLLSKTKLSKLQFNFAQTAVTAVTNRLEVASATTGNPESQALLDQIWSDNELDLELPNLFMRAGEYGDAYLLLDLEVDNDGKPVAVELFYNSPLVCRVIYADDNPRRKAFAIKRWRTTTAGGEPCIRVSLLYQDRIERFVTKEKGARGLQASEFMPYVGTEDEDGDHIVPNELGFLGVYHFRAGGRPYGVPEHYHGYGSQVAINKLAITHLGSIDFLGWPQRYALLNPDADSSDVDDFDADIYHDTEMPAADGPGPGGERGRTAPQSGLTADAGGVWMMPGVREVGQFTPADSKNFLESIVLYVKMLAHTTTTPAYLFDLPGEIPSGESQRAADAPLDKKVGNRKLSYGGTLKDALEGALRAMGVIKPNVSIQWAANQVLNDTESWTAAKARIEAGVPVRQVFLEQGYSTRELDDWKVPVSLFGDSAELTLMQQAQMLEQIGKAVETLSAGVGLGVLTQDLVDEVFAGVIAQGRIVKAHRSDTPGTNIGTDTGTSTDVAVAEQVSAA